MAGKSDRLPRQFRLMPEWLGQSGLWVRDPADGAYDAVSVEEAGFSEPLADRIEDWMDAFDSIFDEDDPKASAFASRDDFDAWRQEGEAIAVALRAELRPGETLEVVLPEGPELTS
ncbi:hypothetical protein [Rhabdaerophilum sp. SD176]|uniref:hypothetical protein n=1 Tax=Rhabdaerophilum sp. SD176 TaxID=2983548 RepID=UPI0024DFEB6E|nr:hypothetical protein [Rhabdaerophilum sp. SD176]